MKIIILAGGIGTRLWPLSRGRFPKQFIKFQDREYSLFQDTFKRSLLLAELDDIYVVTNKNYKFLVMGEVEELGYDYQEKNILIEPEAKNTLPAIYAGVDEIVKKGKGNHDSVVIFPSDHLIEKSEEFAELIKSAEYLTGDLLVTFGIKPAYPYTGYGYISPGEKKGDCGYLVKEFKEKPDYKRAVDYIKKGYYWNSGIFMFNTSIFREEVARFTPEVRRAFAGSKNLEEAFSKIKLNISIDYGIMEKSRRVAVVPADIGWNDLGSFDTFYEVFTKNRNGNIASDDHLLLDSKDNIIVQSEDGKLVVTIGVDDLIIIDNRDVLLVCKKEHSQKVKEVVEELKKKKDSRTEYHVQDYRPWGNYKILEEEKKAFKIKRIKVNSGKKLSYQLHHYRNEHWVVVKGSAKITIDDQEMIISAGESIDIKAGQKHRLENIGKSALEIIEVQMGEYLEEDDIVRFEDEYGRK